MGLGRIQLMVWMFVFFGAFQGFAVTDGSTPIGPENNATSIKLPLTLDPIKKCELALTLSGADDVAMLKLAYRNFETLMTSDQWKSGEMDINPEYPDDPLQGPRVVAIKGLVDWLGKVNSSNQKRDLEAELDEFPKLMAQSGALVNESIRGYILTKIKENQSGEMLKAVVELFQMVNFDKVTRSFYFDKHTADFVIAAAEAIGDLVYDFDLDFIPMGQEDIQVKNSTLNFLAMRLSALQFLAVARVSAAREKLDKFLLNFKHSDQQSVGRVVGLVFGTESSFGTNIVNRYLKETVYPAAKTMIEEKEDKDLLRRRKEPHYNTPRIWFGQGFDSVYWFNKKLDEIVSSVGSDIWEENPSNARLLSHKRLAGLLPFRGEHGLISPDMLKTLIELVELEPQRGSMFDDFCRYAVRTFLLNIQERDLMDSSLISEILRLKQIVDKKSSDESIMETDSNTKFPKVSASVEQWKLLSEGINLILNPEVRSQSNN